MASHPCKIYLELHSPRLFQTSCTTFAVVVLHFILYFSVVCSLPYSPTFYLHYSNWSLHPARRGITIHRRIKKHTLGQHSHSRKQPIFIVHQMFPFQWSAFMHCIADNSCPWLHRWSRMTISIRRVVMMTVRAPKSPRYHPTSKQTIWIPNRKSYISDRHAGMS